MPRQAGEQQTGEVGPRTNKVNAGYSVLFFTDSVLPAVITVSIARGMITMATSSMGWGRPGQAAPWRP